MTSRASLVTQTLKNLPTMQETRSDPCVKEILWKRACNPLQYSCLKNPMDRGAWWATVHEIDMVVHEKELDTTEMTEHTR